MIKPLFAAAILGLALPALASAAETAKCDDASMMTMDEAMKTATMKKEVDMAVKEVDMAKMAMRDGKMDECSTHLTKAMKDLKMQ